MKKLIIFALTLGALVLVGCKSDEEKCREDHDIDACAKVLRDALKDL